MYQMKIMIILVKDVNKIILQVVCHFLSFLGKKLYAIKRGESSFTFIRLERFITTHR